MKYLLSSVALAALLSVSTFSAHADDVAPKSDANPLLFVWGGGPAESSAYTKEYVPKIIAALYAQHMSGYNWGGVSAGTAENAEHVTDHPTNIAVGQNDILKSLQGTEIPGRAGVKYQFKIVQDNVGYECLYAITADPSFTTWGDIVGNAWQFSLVTGGEKSGSFGTWNVLKGLYPELKDMKVTHAVANSDIVTMVSQHHEMIGFFVMRPDPDSKVFAAIKEAGLGFVPVVDFTLEGSYTFPSLPVAHGWGGAKKLETACTTASIFTGDPTNPKLGVSDKRRLDETIKRLAGADPKAFIPSSWSFAGMWDSAAGATTSSASSLMEASKAKLTELRAKHGG